MGAGTLATIAVLVCFPSQQAIEGGMEGISRFEQRQLSVEEAKAAAEVFLISSSLLVMPVVQVGRPAGPCLLLKFVDLRAFSCGVDAHVQCAQVPV
jgi:hypothetical protein